MMLPNRACLEAACETVVLSDQVPVVEAGDAPGKGANNNEQHI
jgi:hypothetical protein